MLFVPYFLSRGHILLSSSIKSKSGNWTGRSVRFFECGQGATTWNGHPQTLPTAQPRAPEKNFNPPRSELAKKEGHVIQKVL